jgi:hypothetical protein
VASVAAFPTQDGKFIALSGSLDSTMRVWEPIAGTFFGPPMTNHASMVRSLAVTSLPVRKAAT